MRESAEQFHALFEPSLDCLYIHDFEGNFLDANPAALKLLGYEREDIDSLSFLGLLSADQMPLAFGSPERVSRNGNPGEDDRPQVAGEDGQVFVD